MPGGPVATASSSTSNSGSSTHRAAVYVEQVKRHLQPAHFRTFLDLLRQHKAGRIGVASVCAEVSELLAGQPSLVSEFSIFLPPTFSSSSSAAAAAAAPKRRRGEERAAAAAAATAATPFSCRKAGCGFSCGFASEMVRHVTGADGHGCDRLSAAQAAPYDDAALAA